MSAFFMRSPRSSASIERGKHFTRERRLFVPTPHAAPRSGRRCPFGPSDSISRSSSCEKVASSPEPCTSTKLTILRRDQIEIDRGRFIFLVIEIEQGDAVNHTDTDRCDELPDRRFADFSFAHQFPQATETARLAPVIAAVRVPPSACSTSQSTQMRARTRVSPDRPPRASSARSTVGSRYSGRRAGPSRCPAACGSMLSRAASNIRPSASRR